MTDHQGAWRRLIPEADRQLYARAGYGQRREPESTNLALLIIDVTYGFTGLRGETQLESMERYPNSCGESAWKAVSALERLIEATEIANRPIIYSRDVSADNSDGASVWTKKHGRLDDREPDDSAIVAEIGPVTGSRVLSKSVPSIFFGTNLADDLKREGVRDLLVTGTTTSGCVRATVVDAFSHGFNVFVIEECVFDRTDLSHAMSLFEMDQKYADVLTIQNALQILNNSSK